MDKLEEIKDILEQCSQALLSEIQRSTQRESCYHKMIEQSESRVNAVNNMVNNLITTMNKLTETYTHHLDQAITNRDAVFQQNGQLLKMVESMNNELRTERTRYETLISRLADLTKTLATNNSNTFNM